MASSDKIHKVIDCIIKSPEDGREYRGLELRNGLKVLVISDPATDKSSASMDVHIGHMSDPDELPGLAHFCEHMLFLGTVKYPEENGYKKFLSEHAGSSNASTSAEHTNFYFDVAPDHLSEAIDRFSQFFKQPLFTSSATEREVNAVNSENDKNIQNDARRLHRIEKTTCNPRHAYSKFGTGNKDSLESIPKQKGLDVRDELLKFHNKYYSSNIMSLCVLGKETLDDLTQLVASQFNDVENRNIPLPEWNEHPYGPEELQTQCIVVPVKDLRSLNIIWPIPDLQPYYKANPGHYLSHLIGHEGPGSLLSELKSRGWGSSLVSGAMSGAKGFMNFSVKIGLTEEGILHVDDIMSLIFQYLNMLRREGSKDWIFKECQSIRAMNFRFKDKDRPIVYTRYCSGRLQNYPIEEVLSGSFLYDQYKPELMQMILDKLVPEVTKLIVVGKIFEGKTNLTEKWYGVQYSISKLPNEIIQKWNEIGLNEKFCLPEVNEFIPTNFDLVPQDGNVSPVPVIVHESNFSRVWYRQDDKFKLPKACISIQMTNPIVYMDPLSAVSTKLFCSLLKDALNEYTYAATLAGLSYDIYSTIYGLVLTVSGFTDNEHVLLQKIVDQIITFQINARRFVIVLENRIRNLRNFHAEQPHEHAVYYTNVLTAEQLWMKEEMLEATVGLTVEKLQTFISLLFCHINIETLVYGNITKEKSVQLAEIVENCLVQKCNTRPLLPSQRRRFREVRLPDSSCYTFRHLNDVHKSSCVEIYYQCSVQETYANVVLELFCQIMHEPCFNILRTQEQLGYIVFSGVRRSNSVQGMRILVQSDKSTKFVEARIEAFLHNMQSYITDMPYKVFENHITALATKRLEKPKNLLAQNSKYWSEITNQQYNYNRDEIEVRQLKSLTKKDILRLYEELIGHNAPKRHKLAVHIIPSVSESKSDDTVDNSMDVDDEISNNFGVSCGTEIDEISSFKRDLGLYPLTKPFISFREATKSKL